RFAGMEHWLPLFYERLETVFDYLPGVPVVFDYLAHEALGERHALIVDHYESRVTQPEGLSEAVPYKPVKPEMLYLSTDEVKQLLAGRPSADFTPFDTPPTLGRALRHAGAHAGRSFAEERADPNANVFEH